MPFLFVDYDPGAGGEKFCAGLSQSPECDPLEFVFYTNGRTKVLDVFDQEFLKPTPKVKIVKSHDTLYTVVPTHRNTSLAYKLLDNIYSIRISRPVDPDLWNQIKEHQIKKVLLTQEPTGKYFIGLLKILKETAVDKDFVRRVRYNMPTIEIILLSKGIDPTQENINNHLETLYNERMEEPKFDYDLIIPYEDLVYNHDSVRNQIKRCFGITVVGDWLNSYA